MIASKIILIKYSDLSCLEGKSAIRAQGHEQGMLWQPEQGFSPGYTAESPVQLARGPGGSDS
jgi:hypothetical protein